MSAWRPRHPLDRNAWTLDEDGRPRYLRASIGWRLPRGAHRLAGRHVHVHVTPRRLLVLAAADLVLSWALPVPPWLRFVLLCAGLACGISAHVLGRFQ